MTTRRCIGSEGGDCIVASCRLSAETTSHLPASAASRSASARASVGALERSGRPVFLFSLVRDIDASSLGTGERCDLVTALASPPRPRWRVALQAADRRPQPFAWRTAPGAASRPSRTGPPSSPPRPPARARPASPVPPSRWEFPGGTALRARFRCELGNSAAKCPLWKAIRIPCPAQRFRALSRDVDRFCKHRTVAAPGPSEPSSAAGSAGQTSPKPTRMASAVRIAKSSCPAPHDR